MKSYYVLILLFIFVSCTPMMVMLKIGDVNSEKEVYSITDTKSLSQYNIYGNIDRRKDYPLLLEIYIEVDNKSNDTLQIPVENVTLIANDHELELVDSFYNRVPPLKESGTWLCYYVKPSKEHSVLEVNENIEFTLTIKDLENIGTKEVKMFAKRK